MSTSDKKIVGIIGGMGPGATALLFQKLIDYTDAKCDAEHVHILIDNNTQIPDRTTAILNGDDTPALHIIESGKKLEQCGAELLIIPCNTSHYFYERIQRELTVPVINMIAETAKVCLKNGYTKVGVLATSGTLKTNIYAEELKRFGIETVYPDENGQKKVMEVIYDQVKAGRRINVQILDQTLKRMAANGAQAFILGCTELPFAIKNGDFGYYFLDSLDILAKQTIERAGYHVKSKRVGEVKC